MAVLPVGAGPGPVRGPLRQTGFHGILLDVNVDPLHLRTVPGPMVERLLLPERLPLPVQNAIRVTCGSPFDSMRDAGERGQRIQQKMDVIWHDDVGSKDEEATLFASAQCGYNASCDLARGKPARAVCGGIETSVGLEKLATGLGGKFPEFGEELRGERGVESPCDEDGAPLRNPVREVAFVVGHDTSQENRSIGIPACVPSLGRQLTL